MKGSPVQVLKEKGLTQGQTFGTRTGNEKRGPEPESPAKKRERKGLKLESRTKTWAGGEGEKVLSGREAVKGGEGRKVHITCPHESGK